MTEADGSLKKLLENVLLEVTEETETSMVLRCTRPFVTDVATNVRYRSNQTDENRFTAEAVSRKKKVMKEVSTDEAMTEAETVENDVISTALVMRNVLVLKNLVTKTNLVSRSLKLLRTTRLNSKCSTSRWI